MPVDDRVLGGRSGRRDDGDRGVGPEGVRMTSLCGVLCTVQHVVLSRINNCVGEGNRYAFLLLIFYTFVLCLTSLALSVHYLVFAHGCVSCDKVSCGAVRLCGCAAVSCAAVGCAAVRL